MSDFYRLPGKTIHFPNLNGLRFIAAFMVIVHHIEQIRSILGMPNLWGSRVISLLGEQGVTLFFVLSGFLITYLLLVERERLGSIATNKFYLRRILRIWPLYFFVVLLGLGILPHLSFFNLPNLSEGALDNVLQKLALFGLILPNAALVLYGAVPYLSQTWSIGTEEQFYLFWPWLIKRIGNHVLLGLVSTAAFFIIGKRVIGALRHHNGPGPFLDFIHSFLYFFRIECMAIGAIFAAILFLRHDAWLRVLMSRIVQWGMLFSLVGLLGWGENLPNQQGIYGVLFGTLILGLAAAKRPILWLEHPWLNYLGKISYGLYMLHMVATVVVLKLAGPWLDAQGAFGRLLALLAVLAVAVLLASISYYGLEKPFLRLKEAFVRVRSQPDAISPTSPDALPPTSPDAISPAPESQVHA